MGGCSEYNYPVLIINCIFISIQMFAEMIDMAGNYGL